MKLLKMTLSILASFIIFGGGFSMAGSSLVWSLLGTQIEIGLNQRHSFGLNSDTTLSMQSNLAYWGNYDLVSELEKSKTKDERLQILEQYIDVISNTVSISSALIKDEKMKADAYTKDAKECSSQADSKNSEFSAAVKKGDYELAQKIANEIADLRACVATNQVQARAHMTYGSSKKSVSDLQKKVDYLEKNKEKIAEYYDILNPDLLKELYDISQTVRVNF